MLSTASKLSIAAITLALAFASFAEAGVLVKSQPKVSALPADNSSILKGEILGEPIAPGVRQPHITYYPHGAQRSMRCGTVTVVLSIKDPCTCSVYEIPVCMPECCIDPPRVAIEKAVPRGRAVGTYVWCGGYKVKIVLDPCGEIAVHTFVR